MACLNIPLGENSSRRFSIKWKVYGYFLLLISLSSLVYAPPSRVSSGLLVLYQFSEVDGATVRDVSGVGEPLDLTIVDSAKVYWTGESLRIDQSVVIQSTSETTKISSAVTASNAITIEAWVKSTSLNQDGPARIFSYSTNNRRRNFTLGQKSDRYDIRLRSSSTTLNGKPSISSSKGTLTTALTHVVYIRAEDGTATIVLDGAVVSQGVVSGDINNWDDGYTLLLANELTGDRPWFGELYLVALYDRALTLQEVQQNHGAGVSVTPPPPKISNIEVAVQEADASITWQTDIDSEGSLSYGLSPSYDSGTVTSLAYGTNHQVDLVGLSVDTEHHFKISATSIEGVSSESEDQLFKTLGGSDAPQILSQPADITVDEGASALFQVDVSGSQPLDFQWYKNGVAIAGATATSYLAKDVPLADNGSTFHVTISNPVDTVSSRSALMSVQQSSRVTEQLLALYTFDEEEGNQVQDRSGSPDAVNLTIADESAIQWQIGALDVLSPTLISALNNSSKITEAVKQSGELTVEVWVTPANDSQQGPARMVTLSKTTKVRNFTLGQNGDGYDMRFRTTATSNNGRPSLSAANVVVSTPTHIVYTRQADGVARLYVDNQLVASTTIAGTTSNWDTGYQFALANELTEGRPWLGRFYLVALYQTALSAADVAKNFQAGPDGQAVDPPVLLTPPTIDTGPTSQTVVEGDSVTFDVVASGSPVLSYQWYKDGAPLISATEASLTINNVQVSDAGLYHVVVSNEVGNFDSEAVSLDVEPAVIEGFAQLSWTTPAQREDGSELPMDELDHYELIYGTDPDNLDNLITIADPATVSYLLEPLLPGTYYFRIRAVDIFGVASNDSNRVSKTIVDE